MASLITANYDSETDQIIDNSGRTMNGVPVGGQPLMVRNSAKGVVFDDPTTTGILRIANGSPRFRKDVLPPSDGVFITDFMPGGAAATLLPYPTSTARYALIQMPDGTERWGIQCVTKIIDQANIDVAISRKFDAADFIDIEMLVPRSVQPNIYLTATNMATYLRYNGNVGVPGMTYLNRHGIVHLRIPVSMMVSTGGASIADTFNKLRISFWNTAVQGAGDVALLSVKLNSRAAKSRIVFTTDDGFQANFWLADQLKAIGASMTAYIITSRPAAPPARYLSWDEVAALKARGNVQIASHSHSHTYVNGGPVGSVWGSTVTGICLSQPVAAGSLLLNGSIGTALFDKPRHLTFVTTAANYGVYVDVVGELYGSAKTERVWLGVVNGYPWPSTAVFDKITSLTVGANGGTPAGNITVGTSCSYDEIYADIRQSFYELESRGLSSPTQRHYCAPQGQWNEILMSVLRDLNVRSCRLTDQTIVVFSETADWYNIPSLIWDNTSYANAPAQVDVAIGSGASAFFYTHDIYDSGAPAGAVDKANLLPLISKVGGLIAAGQADAPTMETLFLDSVPV